MYFVIADVTKRCRLMVFVDETRFATGLYPLHIELLERFNPQLGEADPDLTLEIEAYLDLLMTSGPMQEVYSCLSEWGLVSSEEQLRDDVRQYWFLKYSRSDGKELCSSGFEHVFQASDPFWRHHSQNFETGTS